MSAVRGIVPEGLPHPVGFVVRRRHTTKWTPAVVKGSV